MAKHLRSKDEPDEKEATTTEETSEETKDDFRDEQKAKAQSQGMTADNAVPEQRPQSFLEMPTPHSALTEKLRREGAIGHDETPMPTEAFERAASDEQKHKAAESSQHEQIHVGQMVKATKGPHDGRFIAVTRIEAYADTGDLAVAMSGTPDSRFVRPQRIEGRARGDDRDGEVLILDVEENGLETVHDWRGTGRG